MKPINSFLHVAQAGDGSITYLVNAAPDSLPPVRSGDLADAWEAAHDAAVECEWGHRRLFRFMRPDGSTLDMALADADACCWARAVDATAGLQTAYGLSLCLRLLALVDLLARAPWAGAHCRIRRAGATLDPALVRTAATAPLTKEAGFDETTFRLRLGTPTAPAALPLAIGASA